jgi:hypothetical protein
VHEFRHEAQRGAPHISHWIFHEAEHEGEEMSPEEAAAEGIEGGLADVNVCDAERAGGGAPEVGHYTSLHLGAHRAARHLLPQHEKGVRCMATCVPWPRGKAPHDDGHSMLHDLYTPAEQRDLPPVLHKQLAQTPPALFNSPRVTPEAFQ